MDYLKCWQVTITSDIWIVNFCINVNVCIKYIHLWAYYSLGMVHVGLCIFIAFLIM